MAIRMTERRRMHAADRHDKPQQIDLFESNRCKTIISTPSWLELPVEIRSTLMSLLARLILDHAGKNRGCPVKEASYEL
jgi:hypothetical protein